MSLPELPEQLKPLGTGGAGPHETTEPPDQTEPPAPPGPMEPSAAGEEPPPGALARVLAVLLVPFVIAWEAAGAMARGAWLLLRLAGRALARAAARLALAARLAGRALALPFRLGWRGMAALTRRVRLLLRMAARLLVRGWLVAWRVVTALARLACCHCAACSRALAWCWRSPDRACGRLPARWAPASWLPDG
jgi:hypothetical protein